LLQFKRLTVAAIGSIVLLAGLVMIVTPGPAVVVIPAGLAILATEFLWARRLLQRLRETVVPADSTIVK
jgi:tellurite resistance protein TerC